MHRRDFMLITAAVSLAPALPARAGFNTGTDYRPGMVADLLAEGRTVFVDFSASWCTTCRAQANAIIALKEENPAYEANVAFVSVDWDTYGRGDLAKRLNIPRRSTLVVLKGEQELGRIVAGTSKADIKALMDLALNAAMA